MSGCDCGCGWGCSWVAVVHFFCLAAVVVVAVLLLLLLVVAVVVVIMAVAVVVSVLALCHKGWLELCFFGVDGLGNSGFFGRWPYQEDFWQEHIRSQSRFFLLLRRNMFVEVDA